MHERMKAPKTFFSIRQVSRIINI